MEPGTPDPLQKLLALKRHEQPPPGYFDRFSAGVQARIEAEERAPRLTRWQQWLAAFDAKPILVGAYGVALAGLVMVGFNYVGNSGKSTDNPSVTSVPAPAPPVATTLAGATNLSPTSQTSAPPHFLTNPGTGTFTTPPTPAGFSPDRK